MAGNSCTRHCCWPRRTTPTAKASEVSSTRPSGTIGTRAPAMRRTTCCQDSWSWFHCTQTVAIPTGISSQVIRRRIWLIPRCSSDFTRENLLASAVSCAA